MRMTPLWSPLLFLFAAVFVLGSNEEYEDAEGEENDGLSSEQSYQEITESELIKIATENHIQDPLNSFYDPFEPYRIITYAYWKPITNPALHKNPQIPPNFLPPNAPPKSLPTDFFFQDSSARQLVLEEHAAAFCPFLRRWRDSNPLKPYPIDQEFINNHPPIKFTPGKGYEIDTELDWLNFLSRRATDEFARKFTLDTFAARAAAAAAEKAVQPVSSSVSQTTSAPVTVVQAGKQDKKKTGTGKNEKPKKKKKIKSLPELDIFLSKIEEVKKNRSDCRKHQNFISVPPPMDMRINSPPNCLQEVVFLLEEHEDRTNPVGRESKSPEIVDKVEHYRQILIRLDAMGASKGLSFGPRSPRAGRKCPFGFKSHLKSNKPKIKEKTKIQIAKTKSLKTFKGNVPQFALLKEGEEIFPSESDPEFENVTKYVFPYKLVPFPSIQDTLKKYVSI